MTPVASKYDPLGGLLLIFSHAWGSGNFGKAVYGFNGPDTPHGSLLSRRQLWEIASRTHAMRESMDNTRFFSPYMSSLKRISALSTASPRFCLHWWITPFLLALCPAKPWLPLILWSWLFMVVSCLELVYMRFPLLKVKRTQILLLEQRKELRIKRSIFHMKTSSVFIPCYK